MKIANQQTLKMEMDWSNKYGQFHSTQIGK